MSGRYQDNLNHSLYNRRFIDFTIKRNSEIKQHELNHRVILNYGVNRNINNKIKKFVLRIKTISDYGRERERNG